MRCRRCGAEIKHVPEHLADLAEWVCQQCTNAAPRRITTGYGDEESERKQTTILRRKKEAA